ncbi:protein PAL OF QUIRKY-like [Malania oleifera]|uniref:protein PAL OF QUIRKY-like n=1 Tax=Malania oleifera TaxID=397392 RepID=UPI0025AE78C2|nr:protein PAL OF QUIRKY-like [Malania oleifera]
MDLPPPVSISTAAAAAAAAAADSVPPIPCAKLRLMCSHGGQIVPRPHDKALSYAGGDTRIVAVDRRGATLSSLTSHLAATLLLNRPFILKYQLPGHDLDSLVSVATDEDFENMLDEYDRIANSPTASRLRLFLFSAKPTSAESILGNSESETWFLDALRNTNIVPKGRYADRDPSNSLFGVDAVGNLDSNVDVEAQNEGSGHGGGDGGHGVGSGSVAESLVLETNSSFGSTSSSVSMSNLPPIRAHVDDAGVGFDKKVKLPTSDPIESDMDVANAVIHPQFGNYQETIDSRVFSNPVELEANSSYLSPGIHVQKPVQVSSYTMATQLNQQQLPQELQYVPAGAHYISHYHTGSLPVSSYHQMYHPQLQQLPHHQFPYQPNQPHPVYLLPVGHTPAYNLPMHGNLVAGVSTASTQLPGHPNTSMVPPPSTSMVPPAVAFNEVATASPMPVLSSKVRRTAPDGNPLSHVPPDQNKQFMISPQMHHQSQSIATVPMEAAATYNDEFSDDPALAQIYKTQPLAPMLTSQHQTMTKATAELFSETLTQLHTDNIKPQIRTSQPQ